MSGYQPVYRSILDSTIARDHVARHVYEDLLKLADFHTGIVDMTVDAIARRTNVPEELVRHGIGELEKPDPESRCKLEGGRRLVRLDPERAWGWRIVTFLDHQEEIRLEGKRRRQDAYRERKAEDEGRGEDFQRLRRSRVTEEASRGDAKRLKASRGAGSESRVTEGEGEREKEERGGGAPPPVSSSKGNGKDPLTKWRLPIKDSKPWRIPLSCIEPWRGKLTDDTIHDEIEKLVRLRQNDPFDSPRAAKAKVAIWLERQVEHEAKKATPPEPSPTGNPKVTNLAEALKLGSS